MDDGLLSADTVEQAIRLYRQLIALLKLGGFESNSPEVMQLIKKENAESTNVSLQEKGYASVLGLNWNPERDTSYFKVQPPRMVSVVTKRVIASGVAKLSMGWVNLHRSY